MIPQPLDAVIVQELHSLNVQIRDGWSLTECVQAVCQSACRLGPFERAGFVSYSAEADELSADPAHTHHVRSDSPGIRRALREACAATCRCELLNGTESIAHVTAAPECPCPCAWPTETHTPAPRVCVAMRAGDALVGVLWADNGVTGGPIAEEAGEKLLRLGTSVAGLVLLSRRAWEGERRADIAQRLADVASAIASAASLDEILLMVRSAILDSGILDRVGIFLWNEERRVLVGTWGTDRQGNLQDLHERVLSPDSWPDAPLYRVVYRQEPYTLTTDLTREQQIAPGAPMYGVHAHCALPLAAGDKVLGVLVGDNLLSNRPITEDDVRLLLPFARQAAVAIVQNQLVQSLTAARERLEEEVRHRTQDMVELQAEVSALLQTLTHDLRSPVRAVEGFTWDILFNHRSELSSGALRDVERVQKAAQRMGNIIDSLLALGRMSRRRLELTVVNPAAIVEVVLRDLRPRYSHACEVHVHPMPEMVADPGLIAILYRELLDNAFRATAEVMLAVIEVGYEDGEYYVRDNGVGFDPEYAHTLFDLFRRYDYREETTGTGLALARRIVSMHGGTIRAEGQPGQGATIRFTIGKDVTARRTSPVSVLTHASEAEETT